MVSSILVPFEYNTGSWSDLIVLIIWSSDLRSDLGFERSLFTFRKKFVSFKCNFWIILTRAHNTQWNAIWIVNSINLNDPNLWCFLRRRYLHCQRSQQTCHRSANMSEEVKTLTISVKVPVGDPIKLKVKKVSPQISLISILLQFTNIRQVFLNFALDSQQDTKMEKIFVAIASQLGVDKAHLRFTFDGKRVQAG